MCSRPILFRIWGCFAFQDYSDCRVSAVDIPPSLFAFAFSQRCNLRKEVLQPCLVWGNVQKTLQEE
jgi:hypothetical protein